MVLLHNEAMSVFLKDFARRFGRLLEIALLPVFLQGHAGLDGRHATLVAWAANIQIDRTWASAPSSWMTSGACFSFYAAGSRCKENGPCREAYWRPARPLLKA